MDDTLILIDRIDQRLQELRLSDRKASMNAVGKPDLIRDIRRGKEPGAARLKDLARALSTTIDYLNGTSENPSPQTVPIGNAPRLPNMLELPKDLPAYGTALGADEEVYSEEGHRVAIEMTDLNTGEVLDYFRRPPHAGKDDYVLYVSGMSMWPAFEEGRAILVSGKRPPLITDNVVVYMRAKDHDAPVAVLLKRLVRRSSGYIELEQFNPPARFRIEERQFTHVHKVVPWDEAFGF